MYVCICNAIKETELRRTVYNGTRTAEGAYADLGVQFACAQCEEHAQAVINDEIKNLK